jgi:hypothetical protein
MDAQLNSHHLPSLRETACVDVKAVKGGSFAAGVHTITPGSYATNVQCDADGWTVIQSRGQFGNPQDFFFKDWAMYKAR